MTYFTLYGFEYNGPVYNADEKKGVAFYDEPWPCGRCGGAGGADKWAYTGWICFECGGDGHHGRTRSRRVYTAEKYAKLEATRQKREAKRAAAFLIKKAEQEAVFAKRSAERRESFQAAFPGFADKLAKYVDVNFRTTNLDDEYVQPSFLQDLWEKLQKWGSLSEAQVAAAEKSIANIEADAASGWVGTVGEKAELTLSLTRVIAPPPTDEWLPYKPSSTYLFRDANGNVVKYRGATVGIKRLRVGESVTLSAKVKAHAEYRGVKQTEIERPKIIRSDADARYTEAA